MAGRTVSVIGLGGVGGKLARMLAEAGAQLTVADVDERKRELADELGAAWTDPDSALTAGVDVVSPCALGGALNDDTVPELRCRVIAGAANNQLAADGIAVMLAEREILWAPDFVANAGGIINISVELEPEGYDPARAETRVRGPPARSSTTPTPPAPPRWPPPWRSPAAAWRRPPGRPAPRRSAVGRPSHPRGQAALLAELPQVRVERRVRRPASRAASSFASRSARCEMYSDSFASGSQTGGPWPGHRTASSSSRRRSSAARYSRSRLVTKTLP
jgi:hypothetical protein